MSELGDVLALIHDAPTHFQTLIAAERRWYHNERLQKAYQRAAERNPGSVSYFTSVGPSSGEQPPDTTESISRFWFVRPDRFRVEHNRPTGRGSESSTSVTVINGERWWVHDSSTGLHTSDSGGGTDSGIDHFLDPAPRIGTLQFLALDRVEHAGRHAVRLVGRQRPGMPNHLRHDGLMVMGADECELLIDADRGVLLSARSRLDGEDMAVDELTAVEFDVPVPEELLSLTPPARFKARPSADISPRAVSLTEAAALAQFTVFIPKRVPGEASMSLHFWAPWPDGERPDGVGISYHFPGGSHTLQISEIAQASWHPDRQWEPLEGNRRKTLALGQGVRIPARQLAVEAEGTWVLLSSDLDLDTLLEIANSLEPAPTEPTRLVDASP